MKDFSIKLQAFEEMLSNDLKAVAMGDFALEDEKTKPEVQTLVFEYFFPQLEIAFYPLNQADDQLGYKDLLGGVGILQDADEHELITLEEEKNTNSKNYQAMGNTFADWFAQLWENAGGKKLNLPTFLIPNDDTMMKFDLNQKIWLKDEGYK
ncbi:hypothetical protein [Thermoflexibacter ruber]|uniref:Uncharacterized protein n=1 Tax=Thermoflexibacter ruber TaxID=1003 RepID=A0A1I2GW44_9BACT|nr:hypothetical protein [Thermoflexibacter ruber]SFF21662.1 hypothetical protein SAMN04488541_102066 [Thermoflexibacter ruber]